MIAPAPPPEEVQLVSVPMNYVEPPDVPAGMTLRAYRGRDRAVRRSRRSRLSAWALGVVRRSPRRQL